MPLDDVPRRPLVLVVKTTLIRPRSSRSYKVDVAGDGMDAVRKVVALDPDVVLMDLSMPVMDGWEAIREIRRRAGGGKRRPHVIAVSAHDDAHARKMAFENGCNEYIVKPLDVRGALRAYAWRRAHATMQGD